MRAVACLTNLDDSAWDGYVTAHPGASVYHLAAWPRLLARVFRRDLRLLAVTTDGATQEIVLRLSASVSTAWSG